jgi:hypothetical protein
MKINLLFILLLLYGTLSFGQNTPDYSRVKVFLNQNHTLYNLSALGIAVDHGVHKKGRFYIGDCSRHEIDLIEQSGFEFEIMIEDVVSWYTDPNRRGIDFRGPDDCFEGNSINQYPTPDNFELGSMAGFFTWQEMLGILDDMKAQFPNLISTKQPIEGAMTYEGRAIHWVRISDQPETDEEEPEILYTALHHAREPGSLSQMIFYMWFLLENYEEDQQVQFLVNNTEMYFIPCVNPDGYVFNQTTNPEGGGLWRKNRVKNNDGSYGVDLNRNYGYEWGYDNEGSSNNPVSETYRGTEAFSEQETRAVRDFCNEHEFQITLNYHTHGDLLIYPWGYSDTPTAENDTYTNMAEAMIVDNQYLAGTGSETVGYIVNGGSDDWMYGEAETKPSTYSFTPEVGAIGGFWPTEDQITPNCKNTLLMNLNAAAILHRFGLLKEINSSIVNSSESTFNYSLKRIGLQGGPLTVSLESVSDNFVSTGPSQTYDLTTNESTEGFFSYTLDSEIQDGESIDFLLSLSNGDYTWSDTISKTFIGSQPIFAETNESLDNWTIAAGTWDLTTESFHSSPSSITDSPNGVYGNNIEQYIFIENPIELNDSFDKALLNFWARWEIEAGYDYAQVSLSVNEGAYIPLCGRYSKLGTDYQDEGNPVYDGFQEEWVQEVIDITEFVNPGDEIRIRYSIFSDGYLQEDGFYFDDLEVFLINNISSSTSEQEQDEIKWDLYPNPSDEHTVLSIEAPQEEKNPFQVIFYNTLGNIMTEKSIDPTSGLTIEFDTKNWQPGLYFCKLKNENRTFSVKHLLLMR